MFSCSHVPNPCSLVRAACRSLGAFCVLVGVFGAIPARAQVESPATEPWVGAQAVTETTAEIMARNKRLKPSDWLLGKFERENDERNHNPQNPASPPISQWPPLQNGNARGGIAPHSVRPFGYRPEGGHGGPDFLGATLNDAQAYPPDSMGCVGPTQFLVGINGRIRVFSKAGVMGSLNTTMDNFFQSVMTPPVNSNFTSDPRVRYDRLTQRWFVMIIDVPGGSGSLPNRVLIAMSDGPNISSSTVWSFFYFQHDKVLPTNVSDTGKFADYPTLGIDAKALYIGVNVFGSGFSGTTGFVVRKSSLTSGGPIVATAFRQLCTSSGAGPYTPQGVDNDDPNANEGYFVGSDNASWGTLMFRRISDPGGNPTISANIALTVPSTYFPLSVPTKGTSLKIDAIDDRLFAAQIHRNRLTGISTLTTAHNLAVNTSGVSSSSGTRDGIRWYEIGSLTGTPTLVQSGTIFDSTAANPNFYNMPTLAMSGQGRMIAGSTIAGTNTYASVNIAERFASTPAGTFASSGIARASSTVYSAPYSRWGDYSMTSIDPADDMTIWSIQEFCNATSSYGVEVLKLSAPPPATISTVSPTFGVQGATLNVAVTGASSSNSGFYDPDPAFLYLNRLQAAFSGAGITVNSVTFTDPTHVTVNITIAANAVTTVRDLTITNPDQQATTATGIFLVTSSNGTPHADVSPNPANVTVPHDGDPSTKNAALTLDGSGSSDPNNLTLTYSWNDSGNNVVGTANKLNLSLPAGSYTYTLTVQNSNNQTDSVSVPVTVNAEPNSAPTANAGPDQSLPATGASTNVTMAGSGTDPDNDTLTYVWTENGNTLGTGATPTMGMTAGTHTVILKVSDPYGASATDTVVIAINASTTLTVPDVNAKVGATVALNATLTSSGAAVSGKSIIIKLDGVEVSSSPATTDSNGLASVNYTVAEGTVGTHTIAATFAGDASYPASSGSGTLTVSKSNTAVAVANISTGAGQTVTLSATLTRTSDNGPLSGKSVSFKEAGSDVGTATTDASGVASINYTVPAGASSGTQSIGASFAGDANYNAGTGSGTLTIRTNTSLTVSNATAAYGSAVSLKATLRAGSAAVAGRDVSFRVDGNAVGTATTNSTGIATLPHVANESVGAHVLTAEFAADATYAASKSPDGTLTVTKAVSKVTVSAATAKFSAVVVLRATLKVGTVAIPNTTLTFKIDGVTVGTAATDPSGLASLLHTVTESVGTHTITVVFDGDANDKPSTGTGTLTVQLASTRVAADNVKKTAGSSVTYGAKLTRTTDSSALAGKQLDFYDTATNTLLGSGTTDASGRATITLTAPAVGVKQSITVRFVGDANYAASSGVGGVTGS